mgnify:CR=1 FL=1
MKVCIIGGGVVVVLGKEGAGDVLADHLAPEEQGAAVGQIRGELHVVGVVDERAVGAHLLDDIP